MNVLDIKTTISAWSYLSNKVAVPRTESEYQQLVKVLDDLIDEVGEDESHPLASLMDVVGTLIENYESCYVPELTENL